MRYIEIDGHKVEVGSCEDCPCFEDVDYEGNGFHCNHPYRGFPLVYQFLSVLREEDNIRVR